MITSHHFSCFHHVPNLDDDDDDDFTQIIAMVLNWPQILSLPPYGHLTKHISQNSPLKSIHQNISLKSRVWGPPYSIWFQLSLDLISSILSLVCSSLSSGCLAAAQTHQACSYLQGLESLCAQLPEFHYFSIFRCFQQRHLLKEALLTTLPKRAPLLLSGKLLRNSLFLEANFITNRRKIWFLLKKMLTYVYNLFKILLCVY